MALKTHDSYKNLSPEAQNAVVAIGNFDGLHKGHSALIGAARDIARAAGKKCAVMTFEPHPREFFQKETPPFRLTLLPEKQRRLGALSVDHLFALDFDAALSSLDGKTFVEDVLIKNLGVAHIVVGADFAFGKNRTGNVALLQQYAAEKKFALTLVEPVRCDDGEILSSSRIRAHLARAEFDPATALLGHAWEFEAAVIHGDKRGRTLGYPTANQDIGRHQRPPFGIYAVMVRVEGEDMWRKGAASFGIRPMFKTAQPVFETHIFDYAQEIYGKNMRVRPVCFLRNELTFKDISGLTAQMEQDCTQALAVLNSVTLQE